MDDTTETEPGAATAGLTSTAVVTTDRGGRYAKQLVSHLGRRLETSWDEATDHGVVLFEGGRCDLSSTADGLSLLARVDALTTGDGDPALLARIEDVVGRHLVRFGTRDELVVAWQRTDGSPGGVFRNTDDPDPAHTRPS